MGRWVRERTWVQPLRISRLVRALEGVGSPGGVGEAEVRGGQVGGAEGEEEGLGGHFWFFVPADLRVEMVMLKFVQRVD